MPKENYDVSIVVPIYNEKSGIPELYKRLTQALKVNAGPYEIIFIDDASSDGSFEVLKELHEQNMTSVKVLRLSRNFGHQLAITAGLRVAQGKGVIVMDGDLQDPPEVIPEFIRKWESGYDIVYGVRKERQGETFFKKFTAKIFYKLIRTVTNIGIPENVGDFYLLDRKVVTALNAMDERHRFLRGMVAWLGFKRTGVEYVREPRFSGQTKYTLWKMVKFSFDAATSFSFTPLRVISMMGAFFSVVAFLGILVIFYEKLFTDRTITGWSSLMVVVLFLGGIQLLSVGLIGEYVARIGDDVKRRPLYTVSEYLE
ncbi:MAG TPA: glycosyltransferase family 2 protein [Candidatus Omnitrophota bacterium]|nr:glycosyltransferase family 2 protein [Candidatus Omnitrophota bacterium]HPD84939.1 glycosyltransferase family 2 protein [Candidatus Omnitrophota bacterium]HRZ03797.1 glycosyltransferase family 2 protein [Candidatus Omnitrophota bacterium]